MEDRTPPNVPIRAGFGVDARYHYSSVLIPKRASRSVHDLEQGIHQGLASRTKPAKPFLRTATADVIPGQSAPL